MYSAFLTIQQPQQWNTHTGSFHHGGKQQIVFKMLKEVGERRGGGREVMDARLPIYKKDDTSSMLHHSGRCGH